MPETHAASQRRRLVLAAAFLGVVLVAVWTLPLTQWLDAATHWIDVHPATGRTAFVAAYILGTVLMVPGSVLAMSGGYLFGLAGGLPLVSLGTAFGALFACAAGRGVARDFVAEATATNPRFAALDRALAKRGFLVIVLTRLSLLLPYNLLNYAYGLTRIRYRTYFIATWLGMLPANALYAYLGSIAHDVEAIVSGDVESGRAGQIAFVAGLAALLLVSWIIHRTATRELRKQMGEKPPST